MRSKNFNAGMHSNCYEPVCFRRVVMTDNIELYILILITAI